MKENADKFRALDGAELNRQLKDGADQLFRLRFQMSMGQMDGVKKARNLRKERARILTVLAEKAASQSKAKA
jgi:large subunit ribosomal protein L29